MQTGQHHDSLLFVQDPPWGLALLQWKPTPLFEISASWFCGTGTFLRFIGSEDRHISDYLDSHAEPTMHIRMGFAYPYCFPTPSLIYFRDCFQPHYFLPIYPSLITIWRPRIWGNKSSPSPIPALPWQRVGLWSSQVYNFIFISFIFLWQLNYLSCWRCWEPGTDDVEAQLMCIAVHG